MQAKNYKDGYYKAIDTNKICFDAVYERIIEEERPTILYFLDEEKGNFFFNKKKANGKIKIKNKKKRLVLVGCLGSGKVGELLELLWRSFTW